MQVVKKHQKLLHDTKTKMVFRVIDEIVREHYHQMFFDVEFRLVDDSRVVLSGNRALIYIDCTNKFIKNLDYKYIKTMILQNILQANIKMTYKKIPYFIETLLAARETARINSEQYFYFSYIGLVSFNKHIEEIDDFLQINIPWLALYFIDKYNSEFLKQLVRKFEYNDEFSLRTKGLFESLIKNLKKKNNLKNVLEKYNNMEK